MSQKRRGKPPQLRIVLDSNAIFTQTGHYLLKREVFDLITSHAAHADVEIIWYLPEVVRHERQYQMHQQGAALLPGLQKLEKILGHNLNITGPIIYARIDELIDQQITDLGINVLPLDASHIDWHQIMLNAAYRRAPFSPSEKERGFRDALIAETFVQLVEASPQTTRICRIVLVSADQLLTDAVISRTSSRANVKILPSLDELKGLINTLVSEVTEEFVLQLRDRATTYFYQKGDEQSLYLRDKVGELLQTRFASALKETPEGTSRVELETVTIGSARFKAKNGQRVTWISRVTFHANAYRYEPIPTREPTFDFTTFNTPSQIYADPFRIDVPMWNTVDLGSKQVSMGAMIRGSEQLKSPQIAVPATSHKKVLAKTGDLAFEVEWSVSVSANQQSFSTARIDDIKQVDAAWENSA